MTAPGSWRLPGYAELRELGTGAQGRVVLAREDASGTHVAVKYLSADLLGNARARQTFRNEAELLKRVTDRHVARLIGYVDSPEGAAIVMEAVPGDSLRKVLDEHDRPFLPEAALTVLEGSLRGLAAAHSVGVIHRDYKPANVLVRDDGQSALVDFGVAVLAGRGGVMGTPAYMAPEQWHGASATPATDIYAATCVFYECVTGHKPFTAATREGLMAQHMAAPLPMDDVPGPVRPLVAQGMAKDPRQRQWNVSAFIAELEAIATTNYGPDWERRGLVALGGIVTGLAAVLPIAALGGGALSPGAVAGAVGEAGRALGAKGWLGKAGTAKGSATVGVATAAAAMLTLVFWPEAPDVGGTSSGDYRAFFHRPSVVLANRTIPDGDDDASPLIALELRVTPARVVAGTRVRLAIKWHARTPWGLQYMGPGRFQCRGPNSERADDLHQGYSFNLGEGIHRGADGGAPHVWLFPAGDTESTALPTTKPIAVKSTFWEGKMVKKYDYGKCAWTFDQPKSGEFTVPSEGTLRPGIYKVSPHHPIGIAETTATVDGRLTSIDPGSAGARVEGALPTLEVLEP